MQCPWFYLLPSQVCLHGDGFIGRMCESNQLKCGKELVKQLLQCRRYITQLARPNKPMQNDRRLPRDASTSPLPHRRTLHTTQSSTRVSAAIPTKLRYATHALHLITTGANLTISLPGHSSKHGNRSIALLADILMVARSSPCCGALLHFLITSFMRSSVPAKRAGDEPDGTCNFMTHCRSVKDLQYRMLQI